MSKIRKKHSKEFKFKVAIEALKEQKTIAAICKEFSICESQVNAWKKQLKESGSDVFENNLNSSKNNNQNDLEVKIRELNEYIGELSVENKFFKKKIKFLTKEQKIRMIDATFENLSLREQFSLLNINRSSYFCVIHRHPYN